MLWLSCRLAAAFCVLAACNQTATTTGDGETPVSAPAAVASGDTIILNADSNNATPSIAAALYFGLGSAAYSNEGPELAQSLSLQGEGLSAEAPYRIIGLKDPEQTLQAAFSFIALLHPSRQFMSSSIMAGPARTTLGQFTFDSDGGERHLFFDLTEWVAAFPDES